MTKRLLIAVIVLMLTGIIWYGFAAVPMMSVAAQGGGTPTPRPVTDNDVNRIAKNLYCPVCQNVPLEVCETQACARWREQVRELLAQGYTEPQIRDYFVERFGANTVGVPTDTLSQVIAVVMPALLILVIGGVIGVNLLRWRQRQAAVEPTASPDPTQDDYRARLEAELKQRE